MLADDLRPPVTSWWSRPRRATTCGPDRMASGAHASTCSRRSTSRWPGWGWTTSTSSTPTASIRTRRSRRRWARWTQRCARAGALRRDLLVQLGADQGGDSDPARPRHAVAHLQPSYSMINRWIEDDGLLDTLEEVGAGCIAFSPLAQGLLTDRYLDGVPAGRVSPPAARWVPTCSPRTVSPGSGR